MMEEKTLALEMLKELKSNAKRWFIIAIVELVILILSNLAWLGYINQFETITDETTTEYLQEGNTEGDSSPINQSIGE